VAEPAIEVPSLGAPQDQRTGFAEKTRALSVHACSWIEFTRKQWSDVVWKGLPAVVKIPWCPWPHWQN